MAEDVRSRLAALSCPVEVALAQSADYPLKTSPGIVASSDSAVLDKCRAGPGPRGSGARARFSFILRRFTSCSGNLPENRGNSARTEAASGQPADGGAPGHPLDEPPRVSHLLLVRSTCRSPPPRPAAARLRARAARGTAPLPRPSRRRAACASMPRRMPGRRGIPAPSCAQGRAGWRPVRTRARRACGQARAACAAARESRRSACTRARTRSERRAGDGSSFPPSRVRPGGQAGPREHLGVEHKKRAVGEMDADHLSGGSLELDRNNLESFRGAVQGPALRRLPRD